MKLHAIAELCEVDPRFGCSGIAGDLADRIIVEAINGATTDAIVAALGAIEVVDGFTTRPIAKSDIAEFVAFVRSARLALGRLDREAAAITERAESLRKLLAADCG